MMGDVGDDLYAPLLPELETMRDASDSAKAFAQFCATGTVPPAQNQPASGNDGGSDIESEWTDLWNASGEQFQRAQCEQWAENPDQYLRTGSAAIGFPPDLVDRLLNMNCVEWL
jgi:hypothetical protein